MEKNSKGKGYNWYENGTNQILDLGDAIACI